MLKTTLDGTKDGTNTVFTLATPPISGGVILVTEGGRLFKQVQSSPTGYEFMATGTTITVGLAPIPGQRFFAYVQTSLTQSYALTPWVGLAAPSNLTLTIATAPPAGSNILVVKNSQVLEEVPGTPTAVQYRVTGTAVNLGVPLLPTDVVQIFVPSIATAVLATVPLVGSQDSLNTQYTLTYAAPLNHEPDLIILLDGLIQARVFSAPIAGQYTLQDGRVLRLGIAPNGETKLQVLIVGLVQLSTNPYAFTCERLGQRISIWAQRRAETTEIEEAVRHIYDEYMQMYQWTQLQIDDVFATEPISRVGTVAVVLGSRVVVGTGTEFRVADIGKRFRICASHASYVITHVDALRQTLEIHPAYIG